MGSLQASEFASAVGDGTIDLDIALRWHLQSNHYPPVPLAMIQPAIEAIEAASAGHWDAEVELPDGITYRGSSITIASAIIEGLHLDAFITEDDQP